MINNLINIKTKVSKNAMFAWRRIAEEIVLVPICSRARDLDSIFTLNEVAARIWDLLNGQRSLGEISDIVTQEFDVDAKEAAANVVEFVGDLMAIEGAQVVN